MGPSFVGLPMAPLTGSLWGCPWPVSLIFPVLEPDYVADRIVYATKRRQPQLCLPRVGYAMGLFRLLPICVLDHALWVMGVTHSMDHFVQTRNNDEAHED